MLYDMPEIQHLLQNKKELKRLLSLTKDTDSEYLKKRITAKEYNPKGAFDFNIWKKYFDRNIKKRYEELHKDLLYTDEKQDFSKAIDIFGKLNGIFTEIGEQTILENKITLNYRVGENHPHDNLELTFSNLHDNLKYRLTIFSLRQCCCDD